MKTTLFTGSQNLGELTAACCPTVEVVLGWESDATGTSGSEGKEAGETPVERA